MTDERKEPAPGAAVVKVEGPGVSALANPGLGTWATEQNFALAQRAAKALASSDLVPESYKGKPANCLIALDISYHLGISPLTVMQNLHIIHGRPSWGSSFVIGALNSCGRFGPLRFAITKRGRKAVEVTLWSGPRGNRTPTRKTVEIDDTECFAYTTEIATGERIDGPAVSLEMALVEGWTDKAESKWKTMPELMLRYRAAAFFGRLYAPDILMGMQTAEEVVDVLDKPAAPLRSAGATALQEAIEAARADEAGDPGPAEDPAPAPAAPASADPAPAESAPAPEAKPEPSKFAARAMIWRDAGKSLSPEEEEAIRDYTLDLETWNERHPNGEPN